MVFSLAYILNKNITILRDIDESEYEAYNEHSKRLTKFSSNQQLFTIVSLNYQAYNEILQLFFDKFIKDSKFNQHIGEIGFINFNRHILNFLSSMRTFLDHSEYRLKKLFGENSDRFRNFRAVCSSLYDNCFSYRFIYRLRNYAQHCGMPIGSMSIEGRLDPDTKKPIHSLRIDFLRDKLLEFDSWGPQLEEEIKKLPTEIDVNPHIHKVMECLKSINNVLIKNDLPDAIRSANFIKESLEKEKTKFVNEGFGRIEGLPAIIKDFNPKKESLKIKFYWIPIDLVEMVLRK